VPLPGPGRALISASGSYLRKSFAGRRNLILFWRISRAGVFQQPRLLTFNIVHFPELYFFKEAIIGRKDSMFERYTEAASLLNS
jgi:hypothetical protein